MCMPLLAPLQLFAVSVLYCVLYYTVYCTVECVCKMVSMCMYSVKLCKSLHGNCVTGNSVKCEESDRSVQYLPICRASKFYNTAFPIREFS